MGEANMPKANPDEKRSTAPFSMKPPEKGAVLLFSPVCGGRIRLGRWFTAA
jgi:hypothetical protein